MIHGAPESRDAVSIGMCAEGHVWRGTWRYWSRGRSWPSSALRPCLVCDPTGQGPLLTVRPIRGQLAPTVVCDTRCTGATGPTCLCSCGGSLHGSDHE